MAGLDAQRAVKMGAEELQNYMQELFSWSKDMKLKNAEKKPSKGAQAPQPPVRGLAAEPAVAPPAPPPAVNAAAAGGQQQAGQPGGSARHPAGHTYEHYKEKWDKFDLDAALAADEEEEAAATAAGGGAGGGSGGSSQQRLRGSSRGSSSGGTSSSQPVEIPRARVTVPVGPSPPAAPPAAAPTAAAAPTTAEGWKDAGNAHFKRGDHQRAVDAYTASLALQPSCLAYANRAMAQLKLGRHAAAEADCSEALRLDPLYVKGYQRRATARRQQGNLLGAVEDCESALRLEPNNRQAGEDRAACVQQLLQQQGLQGPARSEQLQVVVRPAAEATARGAAAGEAAGGEDAHIKVSSVQRQKPAPVAGEAAQAEQRGAADAPQQPAAVAAAAAASAAPMAGIQVLSSAEGEDSLPELSEQPQLPAQDVQQPAAVVSAAAAEPAQPTAPTARPAAAPPAAASAPQKVPRTGVEFERAWKGLRGDRQLQAAYLLALQPAQLPVLLKQALTPALLAAAAAALLRPALQQLPPAAVALLEALAGVPRFDINLMSVPARQRAELAADWEAAQAGLAAAADAALASRLAAVRPKYKL